MSTKFNAFLHGGTLRRQVNRHRYQLHKQGAWRGVSHLDYRLKYTSSKRFIRAHQKE